MAVSDSPRIRQLLYGGCFTLVLPVLLWAWARATSAAVNLAPVTFLPLGLVLVGVGLVLMVSGWAALWTHGNGLPMNAFPPRRYVTRGIYQLLPHPIYTGFSLLCLGMSMAFKSASGFWLVSPIVILSCTSLVLGYEKPDLEARFGPQVRNAAALLPPRDSSPPTWEERVKIYVSVLIPWLFVYESVVRLGTPPGAISIYFAAENRLPVWEWTEVIYASTYLVTAAAPLVATRREDLRRFAVRGLLSMAAVFPLYLVFPFVAEPRSFMPQGLLGTLLLLERSFDSPAAALPSFHVIWALLSAELFAAAMPAWKYIWRAWALLVAASCITTGMHGLADLAAGFLVVLLVARTRILWNWLRLSSERIANSWKEWRFGPLRVLNHGAYAGLAGFAAAFIVLGLVGSAHTLAVVLVACAGVLGAALWGQSIEASSSLLRPYGFYGSLLGVAAGTLVASLSGISAWLVLAAFSVCAPWVQAVGRLRCLVQGCCHGRPSSPGVGIRYFHPRSRVARLTAWSGVALHPTPLYSILWNILVGAAVARLWVLHAQLHLIVGMYFILSGLGRFVEEAYRGEPQTPIVARLRLYQWVAVGTVLLGGVFTAVGRSIPAPGAAFTISMAIPSLLFGLFCWFAYGVDFPESNRRFSRLA